MKRNLLSHFAILVGIFGSFNNCSQYSSSSFKKIDTNLNPTTNDIFSENISCEITQISPSAVASNSAINFTLKYVGPVTSLEYNCNQQSKIFLGNVDGRTNTLNLTINGYSSGSYNCSVFASSKSQTVTCGNSINFSIQANDQSPQPNPLPSNNPNSSNTTLAQAAAYPTDAHFNGVKWGGVFDPRVSGFDKFQPNQYTGFYSYSLNECLTSNKRDISWIFNLNSNISFEVLNPLRLNQGDKTAYKIIIPPGTYLATVNAAAGYWGNVWTEASSRNNSPNDRNAQTYGQFNAVYSNPDYLGVSIKEPAIAGPQSNPSETYAVAWFINRGEQGIVGVTNLSVTIKINDYNKYNQWLQQTTGKTCD